MLRNNRERGHLPEAAHSLNVNALKGQPAHSLNVNALKGQPAHSPGQHPGSHGFIPRFIALKGQKQYMNARYYAYAPTGRALTPLCQLPRVSLRSALGYGLLPFQGVHSTCKACIRSA